MKKMFNTFKCVCSRCKGTMPFESRYFVKGQFLCSRCQEADRLELKRKVYGTMCESKR